jgi:phasin
MMAKDPMSSFEIPPEMRNFAEKSVEEARKAFDTFIAAARNAATQIDSQAAAAQAGARDVGHRAVSFAERNVATSFDFAQKLVRAKDMEEMMRLQTEFMKAQMQTLADQAKEISDSASRAAMDAAKPRT